MEKQRKNPFLNIGDLESMNKFILLVVMVILGSFSIFSQDWPESDIWKIIDGFATAMTLILIYFEYSNSKKQLEPIDIYLEFEDGVTKKISTIKRKNFSRAELKGILRELHNSRDNYDLSYMAEKEFLDNIFSIQDGKSNDFYMIIRDSDFFLYKDKVQECKSVHKQLGIKIK